MRERWLVVAGFAFFQTALVHWVAGIERPPAAPDLDSMPAKIGEWTLASEDVSDAAADRVLCRSYVRPHEAASVNLLVAWYRSQSNPDRQPHSPNVCLPGAGWKELSAGHITIGTAKTAITVNRGIFDNGRSRLAVLYWYQTPRRVIAGELGLERYWLVLDAFRDRRTDTSLIRVVMPVMGDGDNAAVAETSQFAQTIYPELRKRLR